MAVKEGGFALSFKDEKIHGEDEQATCQQLTWNHGKRSGSILSENLREGKKYYMNIVLVYNGLATGGKTSIQECKHLMGWVEMNTSKYLFEQVCDIWLLFIQKKSLTHIQEHNASVALRIFASAMVKCIIIHAMLPDAL